MKAVFASTEDGGFGKGNTMPWPSISEDFKHFKNVTMGQTLYAAKTTYCSLPPLSGRTVCLIRRDDLVGGSGIIIGGTSLLTVENLKACRVIYYTRVKGDFTADVYLPNEVMDYIETKLQGAEVLQDTDKCTIYKIANI